MIPKGEKRIETSAKRAVFSFLPSTEWRYLECVMVSRERERERHRSGNGPPLSAT